jgi:hypothetical protein
MKTARVVGIVGACVVFAACSDLSDRIDGDTGGSGAGGDTSGSGAGGHEDGVGGSEATGGSTMGEAGSASGGVGGTGGTGGTMPPTCEEDCEPDGQICDVDTLTCICPPETPDSCPNDDLHCTNVMGDDDDHCGACEAACPARSVCNDGACSALPETIYLTDQHPRSISALALSGDTLFWAEITRVFSMAVTGGPVTPLTQGSDALRSVNELVVDSENLYAIDHNIDVTPPRLYRIPLNGGSPERIVTEGDRESIADVAVQAGVLYYTVGNQLKSVPADATDATGTVVASAAASGYLFGVAVDGPLLFWSGGGPASSIVEGDLISGGDRRTLGATQGSYYGQDSLTTDGARVYWANGATLQRNVYDASTAQETIAKARGAHITAFAVNATTAYYASSAPSSSNPGGRLEKATFGGKPRGIARHQGVIRSLVVGESGVYWTSENKIMRADL